MALKINEQQAVEQNMFMYEDRIKSPSVRFQETTQTYATYFHIENNESTTDAGFLDVASILGNRSPLRFNKIEGMPLYGLEQIILMLQDADQGLDTNYEGEATILPGMIKPLQNDFFMIPSLKDNYIFRVTDIEYDNIMPDNFYRIHFKLEYIDDNEYTENLNKQTVEESVCILENIGTESQCIIKKSSFIKVQEIKKQYNEMVDFYKSMFYDERHNSFLGYLDLGERLYDPLMTDFINKNNLFNEKMDLQTLILTDQYTDPQRSLKYKKSVFNFIESRNMKVLNNFKYVTKPGVTIHESSFYRWHDKKIQVLDIPQFIPDNANEIFSNDFVTAIEINAETGSDHAELIKKFVRGEELDFGDIPENINDELLYLNNNLEVFFFTPIILYIIKFIIKEVMKK